MMLNSAENVLRTSDVYCNIETTSEPTELDAIRNGHTRSCPTKCKTCLLCYNRQETQFGITTTKCFK